MRKITAVIFDMDGLMFATEGLWVKSMMKASIQMNKPISEEYLISIAGLRHDLYDAQLQQHMGEEFDVAVCRKIAQKFFDEAIENGEMKVKKGFRELLEFFKSRGLTIAIASSSNIEDVKHRLDVAGIDQNYFTSIIGGDMVKKAKPDPEVYLKSCQVLGVKPENAMALEDSDVGIEAAAKAGLMAIHIPDLKPSTERTRSFAYRTFENLLEVIDLFEKL